ncbi:hypothetical protein PENPOL_c044G10470 [Penicillium polonicum]|uniref:Uncharacterized protein n=1 Tax=Penicillium polonicum TaxID=60169 RepID=A0A1V6N5P2_PENPO|nr:hypothetical protein PENPOL_c044G10470 [Penicillium polonicum]
MEDWLEGQFNAVFTAGEDCGGDTEENTDGDTEENTYGDTEEQVNIRELLPNGNPSMRLLDELLVPITSFEEFQEQERIGMTARLFEALACLQSIDDARHPSVDWSTDEHGVDQVCMPTGLGGYTALCGQRLGTAAADMDRCEQCAAGQGVFQTCKIAVDTRGLVLFDGACMCCAFRGDQTECSFMATVRGWALRVFMTEAPEYQFGYGVLTGMLARDYDQLQVLQQDSGVE